MNKEELKNKETDQAAVDRMKSYWDLMTVYYSATHRKLKLLDATDKGDLWKALKARFPAYQILPDTNYVTYIKNNILASIYTVAKSAEIVPTSDDDLQAIADLNIALTKVWDLCDVGYYQFLAGERAALMNMGVTQVGWSDNIIAGSLEKQKFTKGNVAFRNIDPLKYMRDPFAKSIEVAGYAVVYDVFHKSVFAANANYKEKFKTFLAMKKQGELETIPKYDDERPQNVSKDCYTLFIYWEREDGKVNEYHIIDNNFLLDKRLDIKPSDIPLVELYCNLPGSGLVGCSEPMKIFANNVAINLMDSIALTAEYKNQQPPKFVSAQAGLNINAFKKHGDEANKTFVVNNDASKAVHYHEFPLVSPQIGNLKQTLQYGMEKITGVDGRYTGRDTGSIITTGGTEEMLNRVTLIDTPKIKAYERYTRRLSMLVLGNLLEFAPKRDYLFKKPDSTKWETITVDFPELPKDTVYQYSVDISSELPKNKQRNAALADMLMEKQMQYREQGGGGVDLITEEEWLMLQDLPHKERFLERMGLQRATDALMETSQVLFGYGKLVEEGMDPNQALLATADMLNRSRSGQMQQPDNIDMMQQEADLMQPQQMGMPIM